MVCKRDAYKYYSLIKKDTFSNIISVQPLSWSIKYFENLRCKINFSGINNFILKSFKGRWVKKTTHKDMMCRGKKKNLIAYVWPGEPGELQASEPRSVWRGVTRCTRWIISFSLTVRHPGPVKLKIIPIISVTTSHISIWPDNLCIQNMSRSITFSQPCVLYYSEKPQEINELPVKKIIGPTNTMTGLRSELAVAESFV